MATEDHGKLLDSTISNLIENSDTVTKSLENRVAELIQNGDTSRNSLIGAYQQYADAMAATVSDLKSVSANTVEVHTELGIGSGVLPEDNSIEDLLLQDAVGTVRENFMNHAETVATAIVTGAVVGVAANQLAKTARANISGAMMSTDDPEISRLQRALALMALDPNRDPREFADLRRTITNRLGLPTAGSLNDRLRGITESVVMKFDGAFTANRAKRFDIKRFRYEGGVVENTRPWCMDLDGQTFTEEEIESMWSSDWAGKSGDNPWVDRGGHNCRHYWVPVTDEE
jgi:hypothetical protein